MADWNPPTMAQAQLVEDAAVAAWRKKRCVRVESARLAKRTRQAQRTWDRKERDEVYALVENLGDDPRGVVDELMDTRAGVARLIEMWQELAEAAIDPQGWGHFERHHLRLFHLLGRQPGDPDIRPNFELSWRLMLYNVEYDCEQGYRPFDDDEAEQAAAKLRGCALANIERLREYGPSLPDPTASRAAQAELEAFQPKPEDAPLQRYEAQLSRQFHRSLADLVKLTQSGADLVEPEAPTEANLDSEAVGDSEVASEPASDESAPEPASDDETGPSQPATKAVRDRDGRAWPLEAACEGSDPVVTPRSDQ